MVNKYYEKMWEDFADSRSLCYLDYKFKPNYRVGLTNYLRESFIYKFVEPNKNDIILDAGCASGRQLFYLSDKIKSGYGTDIAKNFIKTANKYKEDNNLNNLNFKYTNLENLPFDNNFFDKIICGEVLEHVFNVDTALNELVRVVKTGGVLVITVPNLNADATIWGRFLRLLSVRKFEPLLNFSEKSLQKHGDAHVREFNKKKIYKLFKKYDLEIKDIKSISFIDGPLWFEWILKVLLHISIFRKIIIGIENMLTNTNLFFGRHLIIKAIKK